MNCFLPLKILLLFPVMLLCVVCSLLTMYRSGRCTTSLTFIHPCSREPFAVSKRKSKDNSVFSSIVPQGRYKTRPRMAKATSMSVLNRLSHPLMGYDTVGALAPKARKRRQESVERVRKTSSLTYLAKKCCPWALLIV